MRTLLRDRKIIYYANASTATDQTDAYGNITGVPEVTYDTPVRYDKLSAPNVKGIIKSEQFGLADSYETTFATHDMNCPIKADSRLWVNREPYDANHNLQPHTHVVKAIIPTITAIRLTAEEVSVS